MVAVYCILDYIVNNCYIAYISICKHNPNFNVKIFLLQFQEITNGIDPDSIGGIGFDATCSMVVLDQQLQPVSVCPQGNPDCNIVMWLDHRAISQAELINSTNHRLLSYVGGTISTEMQAPKLLWLKKVLHVPIRTIYAMYNISDSTLRL